MQRSLIARLCAVGVTAGALIALPFAVSAPAAQSASCKALSTVVKSGKITATFGKCSPAALAAGGTATFTQAPAGTTAGTLKLTMTWKGSKGKTLALVKFQQAKTKGKCATGQSRFTVNGTVSKGGTGVAATIIKTGEKLTSSTCAYTSGPKTGQSNLEPGTLFKL
jgi:hypothetical protein